MSTDSYHNRIFRRGFILSLESLDLRSLGPTLDNVASWRKVYFGPLKLWLDSYSAFEACQTASIGVAMVGFAVNPFRNLSSGSEIVRQLHSALCMSDRVFLDEVDELTGSFVLLFRRNDRVFLIGDAACTKTCYFGKSSRGYTVAASHIGLLAKLLSSSRSATAARVMNGASYRGDPSRYLPGCVTLYDDILPVFGNQCLDFQKGVMKRFFPREPLVYRELDATLIDETASILRLQLSLLMKTRKVAIAATAGRDSRVSVATLPETSEGSYLFTFMNSRTHQFERDVEIASKLARIKGHQHKVFDFENCGSPDFIAAISKHSPELIWPKAAQIYCDEFVDITHLRSTVSEIGRCFYKYRRELRSFDASILARAYTKTEFSGDDELLSIFENYINITSFHSENIFNYSFLDLFYWEHRNSKWQNVLCSEAEMASDVFIPYNNRRLLMNFLSIPEKDRLAARLHVALIKELEPRFERIEFDSNA